jgi:hypothetical protein
MKLKIHGILTVEDKDRQGDVMVIRGINLDRLNDEGPVALDANSTWACGRVKLARAIYSVADCRSDVDRALLDLAKGVPFVKIQAEIWHKDTAEMIEKNAPKLFFAMYGRALQRAGERIQRSEATKACLTFGGVHKAQKVFLGSGD